MVLLRPIPDTLCGYPSVRNLASGRAVLDDLPFTSTCPEAIWRTLCIILMYDLMQGRTGGR